MGFEFYILLIFILATLSIVFSTVKFGISPMPSSRKAFHAVVELLGDAGEGAIADLGSGWGNFVVPLAWRFPQRQIIGYEMSLLPFLVSLFIKQLLRLDNLTLYRKDFLKEDLSNIKVLVCYLYPGAMVKIESKLSIEKAKDQYLISNNFALPNWKPEKVMNINDFYKSPVYRYKLEY